MYIHLHEAHMHTQIDILKARVRYLGVSIEMHAYMHWWVVHVCIAAILAVWLIVDQS